jgi:hypothetical protein
LDLDGSRNSLVETIGKALGLGSLADGIQTIRRMAHKLAALPPKASSVLGQRLQTSCARPYRSVLRLHYAADFKLRPTDGPGPSPFLVILPAALKLGAGRSDPIGATRSSLLRPNITWARKQI